MATRQPYAEEVSSGEGSARIVRWSAPKKLNRFDLSCQSRIQQVAVVSCRLSARAIPIGRTNSWEARPQVGDRGAAIQLRAGADPREVVSRLDRWLPDDVRLLTREQYVRLEQKYWDVKSPIGFIFNLGALVGFIVGAVIVYQILYTDVMDHLSEYATLKAMGYTAAIDGETGYVTRNMLCMPLLNRQGEIIGVVQLLNRESAPAFSHYDEQRMREFLRPLGVILETSLKRLLLAPPASASRS